jgi:putative hemolysin
MDFTTKTLSLLNQTRSGSEMRLLPFYNSDNKSGPYIPEGTVVEETLLQILNYKILNKVYCKTCDKDPVLLINSLLEELDLRYEIPEEDLRNIPESGGFITVSNHPYRGIDSILLLKIILERRSDFKVMASASFQRIDALRDIIIPVTKSERPDDKRSSFTGIREGILHVKNNHCLGIFPAGEITSEFEISKIILDTGWQTSALKFIKNSCVPVIPVYFHGTKSKLSYIIRKINPLTRFADLPAELVNKRNRIVKIRIGSQVTPREQSKFKDIARYGRYLRARTYLLGSNLEAGKFFLRKMSREKTYAQPVIPPSPRHKLAEEFKKVRTEYELFSTGNYSVICAPTWVIPEIFNEIGRLRELTFREVGEGTNKSLDIDEYDIYYHHLFIWETAENRIVGAYRIGKGYDIAGIYGIKGFYINSLFKISKKFLPVLSESLELGRSFIIKEYQKKAIPLFLLWKGIMLFLVRNQEYRYLIGPVSMSNDFSKFSKSLIVEFISTFFFDREKARHITPRKEYVVKPDRLIDREVFIDAAEADISKIEKIIMNIEPGYRMPVLLKKYLEINGKIIGFNIDPKFNDCLDGLIILDVYNTPPGFVEGLSRELKDESVIERFRLNQERIRF